MLLAAVLTAQESIRFESGTFSETLKKAKKENKIIFLDAFASWCGPCKLMEKNVFTNAAVKDFYNSNFINARIDMEKGEGPGLAQKYQVGSYPTYLFLNGDGEIVYRSLGYMESGDFLALGQQANTSKNKLGGMKQQFEKGEKDPVFLRNTIKAYANSDREFAKKVAERYFQVKTDKTYTQEEISILLYFLRSTKDPNYKVFTNAKDEITKILPVDIYNQFDTQLKLSEIAEKAVNQQSMSVDEQYFMTEAVKIVPEKDAKAALAKLKMSFYASTNNYPEYEKAALSYYGDGEGFSAQELAPVAYIFYEKSGDMAALKKALVWAEKAVMAGETFENAFVLAKLYQKTGNSASAKMYAEQAIRLAQQAGADTTPIQQFLSQLK